MDLTLTDIDREFIERELSDFLPDQIFDAHAHLFHHNHYGDDPVPPSFANTPAALGSAAYRELIEMIHPDGRTVGGLFFGLVFTQDRQGNNEFITDQTAANELDFSQLVIAPEDDPEWVRQTVRQKKYVGLKCYHTMAKVDGPTWHAPIEAYLIDEHVRIAHEEGLSITLHMVRDRALADPINQKTIRHYCEKYPNMRLILAHAARGFNPWHTIEGIGSLAGLDNVWFDTSAVTEAGAFEAIVETMGHTKLLYGTDFPVSHIRGRCIAIGDSFHWLYADEMDLDERHAALKPVLVGLESLRSIKLACNRLKLSDAQVEDLFYNNAMRLFGQ